MSFEIAYPEGVGVGRVVNRPIAAAQAWEVGALLNIDGNGALVEVGADPAAVAAVALAPTGADTSGFNILAQKAFPPGTMQAATVRDRKFTAAYVGALPAADGGSYGVVRDTDGKWKVDFTEVVALVVKLVDRRTASPENVARVVVEFLPAVVVDI